MNELAKTINDNHNSMGNNNTLPAANQKDITLESYKEIKQTGQYTKYSICRWW